MTSKNKNLTIKQGDKHTLASFSQVLSNYESSITKLLHEKYGISPQEFYVSAINAIKKQPKLLQCDPRSLFGAILLSAEVGLRFNTPEQHAFILPYGNEAKFQIGYKGLIEMMYRNPRVLSIFAEVVKENDEFDYEYGLHPNIHHKPLRKGDRGKVDAVYAVCKLKDADPIFTVIELEELEKVRKFSQSLKSKNKSAWDNDVHNFMDIKAGIKKLSKLIPNSSRLEISKAIDYDSRFEGGAKVWAQIPTSPDEIIEPELSDDSTNKIEKVFDSVITDMSSTVADVKPEEKPKIEKSSKEESAPKKNDEDEIDFDSVQDHTTEDSDINEQGSDSENFKKKDEAQSETDEAEDNQEEEEEVIENSDNHMYLQQDLAAQATSKSDFDFDDDDDEEEEEKDKPVNTLF